MKLRLCSLVDNHPVGGGRNKKNGLLGGPCCWESWGPVIVVHQLNSALSPSYVLWLEHKTWDRVSSTVLAEPPTTAIHSPLILSHTRTVVRECFKGDEASQWKRPKFDPSPHQNPLTDLHKNWQAWLRPGRHPACKICSNRFRGFCSPNTWFCRLFGVTSFFFVFWSSSMRLQPTPLNGFLRKNVRRRRSG